MLLFQEPLFLRAILEPYISLVFGKYFNTGLLILYGIIIAALLLFVPKDHKLKVVLAASVLFSLLSAPLANFLLFILLVYILYLCSNHNFRLRSFVFWGTEALLLTSSILLFEFTGNHSPYYAFAAYYTMFRSIHYYIDVKQGALPKARFRDYIAFLLFFPSFSHGPIDRIGAIGPGDVTRDNILFGIKRILIGISKYLVLVYILSHIQRVPFSWESIGEWLLFSAYGNAIQLYVLLSGDIDIVIGIASLMGFRISENYPKIPYLQPTLTKFWQNWQAMVVNWLTAYVYFPLCRNRKHIYLKTMFIIMIIGWLHLFYNFREFPTLDLIVYYTLWGIFLGGALALSKMWERKKAQLKEPFMAAHPRLGKILYADNALTNALGIFITFNIIAIGWNSPLYILLTQLQ